MRAHTMLDRPTESACNEYSTLSRRGFLGFTGAATAAALVGPSVALGGGGSRFQRPTLVGIFLRGAMDGLSTVVPYGDPALYAARPTLAVPPPSVSGGALDLDGYFGLNPNAGALMEPYRDGHLAIVQAAGSSDPSRSHFSAMRSMETGTPDQVLTLEVRGWLARHLQSVQPSGAGALRAIALGDLLPRVLVGAPGSLPIPDPGSFSFPGSAGTAPARRMALEGAYASAIDPLAPAAASSVAAIDLLAPIDFAGYVPANGAQYPFTPFGQALMRTAALIKADVGIEAVNIDYGGWDHHAGQGPLQGLLAGMLQNFSGALAAFYQDLRGQESNYLLYANGEFGRRVAENGSAGTDHGTGGVMFLMGSGVVGGRVHGTWPTCDPTQLVRGDLRTTTDYRDILAEVLVNGLGGTDLPFVFDGHTATPQGIVV